VPVCGVSGLPAVMAFAAASTVEPRPQLFVFDAWV
jgi:hypothetical protein